MSSLEHGLAVLQASVSLESLGPFDDDNDINCCDYGSKQSKQDFFVLAQSWSDLFNLSSNSPFSRESSQFHRPPDLYFISFISTIEYT